MCIRDSGYSEVFGTSTSESLSSSSNKIVWGLGGNDSLTNSYSSSDQFLFGGSGNDTYTVKRGSTALVYEAPNHGYDKLYLESSYEYGYACTIDNRHIVAIENAWSNQAIVVLEAWNEDIEEIHLGGTPYTTNEFLKILPSLPGYIGNLNWDGIRPYVGESLINAAKDAINKFKSSTTSLESKANNLTPSYLSLIHI